MVYDEFNGDVHFFGFDLKYLFRAYLAQKFKIVCRKWILIPRLIWICRIQWWSSLHLIRLEMPSLSKFGPKMKIVSFSWNLSLSLTQIWRIQWWCSLFLFLSRNILFMANLFQKIKILCWSWNLEPRLIWICRIWWWFSFYYFLDWKYPFWVKLDDLIWTINLC